MRAPRAKPTDRPVLFHCTSRLTHETPFLDRLEKEFFRRRMRKLARSCHMPLINYSVMGNHFHILCRPPRRVRLSDTQILAKLRAYYGPRSPQYRLFQELLGQGPSTLREQLRAQYLARMGDVSVYMKELKEGFSRWYNRRHQRQGTLWAKRFDSVTIQDTTRARMVVSAYIDLNCVRAGLVADPKAYRFCGYAEALSGGREARRGLASFLPPGRGSERLAFYRQVLFGTAGRANSPHKAVLKPEVIARVLRQGGRLSLAQVLRVRVRYLTQGAVLGSREFVEAMWRQFYRRLSPKRRSGARKMKGADWGELRVLRDLQKDVIG